MYSSSRESSFGKRRSEGRKERRTEVEEGRMGEDFFWSRALFE